MFFAQRTVQRFKAILLAVAIYALVVLALAIYWPAPGVSHAAAFTRWFLGIPVALALWACFELFGHWALSRPAWTRMPSWLRVSVLVLLICCVTVLAVWVQQLLTTPNAA